MSHICSRRISYNPLQSQTSHAIDQITTADVRPIECIVLVSSSVLLDVLYCHCRVQTRQKVFKTCDKLQRLHKPFFMRSSQTSIMMHMSILVNDLGWQNLETQRQIQKAVIVYKSLNCPAPDYMSSKFILRSDLINLA